jgi:hypothetical protein
MEANVMKHTDMILVGEERSRKMRLGKPLQRAFGLTLVVLLLAGCGGATGEPTDTPTPAALQCITVEAHLQEFLVVNLYTVVGTSEAEVEGLQVDITCELGQASQRGSRETVTDHDAGRIVVNIDEERTYADTQHSYRIVGKISYGLFAMDILADYDLTVSGGVFGDTPQTCRKP